MKICRFCQKKLRADNNIEACREHRNMSDSRRQYIKKYANDHEKEVRENKRRHYPKAYLNRKKRLLTDPIFKLQTTLRTRLNTAIRRRGKKSGSSVANLGCSIIELKQHLEAKFKPGMSWENHGSWHIDHIRPLSLFDLSDIEQLKVACHFSNLQPLWALENIKKSNRV